MTLIFFINSSTREEYVVLYSRVNKQNAARFNTIEPVSTDAKCRKEKPIDVRVIPLH